MELNTPESKQLLQVLNVLPTVGTVGIDAPRGLYGPAEAWPGSGGRHRARRDARPVLGRGQLPDGLIA